MAATRMDKLDFEKLLTLANNLPSIYLTTTASTTVTAPEVDRFSPPTRPCLPVCLLSVRLSQSNPRTTVPFQSIFGRFRHLYSIQSVSVSWVAMEGFIN